MSTTANTRQDLPSPDFTDAEASARSAAKEFADTAALEGRAVALALFNRRVSFWANHFTNVRYRRWVYVLGECMDGETHEFTISQAHLMKKYQERFPGKSISHSTIQRYNEAMDEAGIFDVIHHRQDSESENPGAYESTEYHAHFSRVLIDGQVVPHDFTQVSPGAKSAETDTSHTSTKTSDGLTDGLTDGSGDGLTDIRLPSTSSPTSSKTASSSLGAGRDDEGGIFPSGKDRATDDRLVDPDAVEDMAAAINDALARMSIKLPVPFTFARLGAADRARVPGLIDMLYREDGFDVRDLLMGLVQEGGHKPRKILEGASWLNVQLRGVSEAELRKWIARGREHYAALEREIEAEMAAMAREEAERQEQLQRYEEARQARLEAARAQAEAKTRAEEDARQLVSAWVPTLDGVRVRNVLSSIRDEPAAFYIDVMTGAIRPARGSARLGEARVYLQQSDTGPVLVNQ